MVIINCHVEFGTFQALLSDLPTGNNFSSSIFSYIAPPITFFLSVLIAKWGQTVGFEKKKAFAAASAQKLSYLIRKRKRTIKLKRTSIFFSILMELIKPNNKQKIRMTSIVAETTLLHYIRRIKIDNR